MTEDDSTTESKAFYNPDIPNSEDEGGTHVYRIIAVKGGFSIVCLNHDGFKFVLVLSDGSLEDRPEGQCLYTTGNAPNSCIDVPLEAIPRESYPALPDELRRSVIGAQYMKWLSAYQATTANI